MVLYAKDIVEKDCIALPGSATVLDAAETMTTKRHGFVLIGAPNRPEGMVTEWDILEKVVAAHRDPRKVALSEIMSTELVSVDADEGIAVVANMMTEKGVRRMLVTKKGDVVGVITAKTVLARLDEYVNRVSSQISKLQAPWV
ncbi:MAG TPA: CBS domain-containing protein [Nitrososphaerales archaeon]|nr:CBS domain-containing protein [Nitrososphaerales archaeon]